MSGGPDATTRRSSTSLTLGRALHAIGTALWIAWVAFVAYFWITRGFAGIPRAPMVGFALLVPLLRWLSEWAVTRDRTERAAATDSIAAANTGP